MKKSFIILSILTAGVASAATLQYGLDFNTMGASGGLSLSNIEIASGTDAINKVGDYVNWSQSTPLGATGDYSHGVNGGTFEIANDEGISGLSFTSGITVGMHLNYTSTTDWKDALTFKISGVTFRMEMNGSSKWVAYGGASSLGIADDTAFTGAFSRNTWHYLAITFQGSTMSTYVDGVLASQLTLTLPSGQTSLVLQQIKGCGTNGATVDKAAVVYVDNFAVYDGVLTTENMEYLSKNAMVANFADTSAPGIPEPATATLSLLALAGLCARRRRK